MKTKFKKQTSNIKELNAFALSVNFRLLLQKQDIMNTIKDLSKNWWDNLLGTTKIEFVTKYIDRASCSLTDEEIRENIFYNEIIVKWWDKHPNQGELHNHSWSPSIEEIKEIYLKEHSKEEPKERERGITITMKGQPLSVNKDFEVDEEKNKSDKEIIDIALGKFKNFGKQPNVEDNSWDEVERILYNYDQPIGNKIAMLKAKFTITKKQ